MSKQTRKTKIVFPPKVYELLEADAQVVKAEIAGGEDVPEINMPPRTQDIYRYRARERIKQALEDIIWYAETQDESQIEQVFPKDIIERLILALCGSKRINEGREPLEHLEDKQRLLEVAEEILYAVNGSLNSILNQDKVSNVKRIMDSAEHNLYHHILNIVILQKMDVVYFNEELT